MSALREALQTSIVQTNAAMPLPALLDKAVDALTHARSAAEILEARDLASIVYDTAKKAARLAKAKQAHDELITAAYRTQANALEIEAKAKLRLADEYDAAQERGEVRAANERTTSKPEAVSVADIGLTHKAIHEAREIRDAEEADPGIVSRTLEEAIDAGEEPTRAKVKAAVKAKSKRTRGPRHDPSASNESQHDRDLRMLMGVWEGACKTAQAAFLEIVVT